MQRCQMDGDPGVGTANTSGSCELDDRGVTPRVGLSAIALSAVLASCAARSTGGSDAVADTSDDTTDNTTADDTDADADADGDSDADGDADGDADSDGDTDSDSDTDGDADADSDGDGDGEALNCITMRTPFEGLSVRGYESNYICALTSEGAPLCWGWNGSDLYPPLENVLLTEVVLVGSRRYGLNSEGSVVTWGYDPVDIQPTGVAIVDIDASANNAFCTLDAQSVVRCYESNGYEFALLVPPPEGEIVKIVSSIRHNFCVLKADQGITCVHDDTWDCGDSDADSDADGDGSCCIDNWCEIGYTTLPGAFVDVAGSWGYVCGLRVDATPYCVRRDGVPMAGTPENEQFVALAMGGNRACGVAPNGTLKCWDAFLESSITILPEGLYKYVALASTDVACGIGVDGVTTCCGSQVPHPDSADAAAWPP